MDARKYRCKNEGKTRKELNNYKIYLPGRGEGPPLIDLWKEKENKLQVIYYNFI